MSEPLGDAEPITLRQKGKRRGYLLPTYSSEEIECVRDSLIQRFFQAGIVALGTVENALCFTVTAYGRLSLGE
jgi:metallophosphoesterase superfamily enzyme